jgi:hypothetical protein
VVNLVLSRHAVADLVAVSLVEPDADLPQAARVVDAATADVVHRMAADALAAAEKLGSLPFLDLDLLVDRAEARVRHRASEV